MPDDLFLAPDGRVHAAGAVFDPWAWRWQTVHGAPLAGDPVDPVKALAAICSNGAARRLPVGVIGPRAASPVQETTAGSLGRRLAEIGLTVICGGRGGVMSAVARGARAAGGLTIGILPETDWRTANEDIVVPLATGLNEARNVVIARAAVALIAVGGSPGTLTEIAFGLHFGRPVIGLDDAPDLLGVQRAADIDDALDRLAKGLLDLS